MEKIMDNYLNRTIASNVAFMAALLKPLLEGPAPNSVLAKVLRRIAVNSGDKELEYTITHYKDLVEDTKQNALQTAQDAVLNS